MRILAFDTANNNNDVAILENQKIISRNKITETSTQAESLVISIEECLKNANLKYQDIDLVATNKGPGNFTGIRIAFSVAKTISMVQKIPLLSFNSLEILAYEYNDASNFKLAKPYILALIDARLEEFFIQEFEFQESIKAVSKPSLIKYHEINEYLPKNSFLLIGNGKEIAKNLIKPAINFKISDKEDEVKAANIGLMAFDFYQKNIANNAQYQAENEILYIRKPNITTPKS